MKRIYLNIIQLILALLMMSGLLIAAPWVDARTPVEYEKKWGVKVDYSKPAYVNNHGIPQEWKYGTISESPWWFSFWVTLFLVSGIINAVIARRQTKIANRK